MDLKGTQTISASRETVWRALNDPEVLRKAIPGCETLTATGPETFEAVANAAVGPVKARFKGKVTLTDIVPPERYTLTGEGQGGVAGHARGAAQVRLEAAGPSETVLHYDVQAQVGGKIAQVGQRLVDAAAKKMADEFFRAFAAQLAPAEPPATAPETRASTPDSGLPEWMWIAVLIAAVTAITLAFAWA